MVVRVYISGISGNKEVKKRQQRVTMILESKNIEYSVIDITEPGKEAEKEFMQENSRPRDSKHPLPPQIFNDDRYCGDYEEFDMANELDELEKFLNIVVNNNSSLIGNGIDNGSKMGNDSDLLKEETRESMEETIDPISRTDSEPVSLSNESDTIIADEKTSREVLPTTNEVLPTSDETQPESLSEIPQVFNEVSDIPEQLTKNLSEG